MILVSEGKFPNLCSMISMCEGIFQISALWSQSLGETFQISVLRSRYLRGNFQIYVLWSRSLRDNFQISVLWSRSLRENFQISVLWSRSLRENFQISVLWSRSLRRIPNLWSLISISEGKFQKMCMSDRNSVSQLSQSQAEVAAKADSKLKQQTLWLMYRWHLWEIFFSIHQSCSPKDLWVRYTFALFERNFSFRINNTLAAKEEYG